MDIKNQFRVKHQTGFAGIALLLLRLVVGIAFMYHGWGKIQTPFNWIPVNAGMPIPGIFQFLAAISEFGGGLFLILGLLTPLASLGIACTMLVATYTHAIVYKDPFVNLTGGSSFEPALSYFVVAVAIIFIGPGKYSLDKLFFGEK